MGLPAQDILERLLLATSQYGTVSWWPIRCVLVSSRRVFAIAGFDVPGPSAPGYFLREGLEQRCLPQPTYLSFPLTSMRNDSMGA